MAQSAYAHIKSMHGQLGRADQKIADYILEDTTDKKSLTIQGLADAVGVSTATVSRFVKRIGFNSYRDFSLSLAVPNQRSNTFFGEIETHDNTEQIVQKVFNGAHNAIDATFEMIDPQFWHTAADWLIAARRVGLFGIGGSSIVALNGYHKLLRTPLDVEQHPDYDVQLMQSVRMRKEDVAIVISHSGRNKDTLKITRQLKANNVKIIAITAFPNSMLASLADLVLASSAEEVNMRSESMSSLVAQITIMDSLFTMVGVKLAEDTQGIVDEIRTAIDSTRE